MVVPFMTIYLTEKLNYTIARAGFIMGLFGLGSIAGALIGGKLTDRTWILSHSAFCSDWRWNFIYLPGTDGELCSHLHIFFCSEPG